MKKLFFFITIHILLLLGLRFVAWPENLLWPYLNFHGFNYHRDMFILYPPFYWLTLGNVYRLLGLSVFSLKIFSCLLVILTDILLYLAAKRKVLPLLFYIPLQIFFEGNGAWVDQMLAPIFLSVLIALNAKKYFLVGFFLGLALITKQTAVYFFIPLIFILYRQWLKILLGAGLPLLLLFLFLLSTQSLSGFFESTIKYILTAHAKNPWQTQWPSWQQTLITLLVFLPAFLGIFKKPVRLLSFLAIFAAFGIFTRFEYFHLQPALPLLALVYGQTLLFSWVLFLIFTVIFVKFYFRNFGQEVRFFTPDLLNNAVIMNRYVQPGGKTLFLNTWDHYYFLTKTLPSGNFFAPSAPWTLDYDGVQAKLIAQPPRYIFYNSCFPAKNTCYQPQKIALFLNENYQEISKLPDGTGVFEYRPVALGEKVQ